MTTEHLYDLFRKSTGISTDTRTLKAGNIFFALKGENFNGNQFAEAALKKGASYAVVDEEEISTPEKSIFVEDALQALQSLASLHRKNLNAPVIAVCGSNGKTTTKDLIQRILTSAYKTFATQGNLNNHIGVPLTVLSIPITTEMAVIEIGANHLGETASLCELAQPDAGLITNNGKDHLEGYGSLENVRKGNGELYEFLRKKNGLAFVCTDEKDLVQDAESLQRITYGEGQISDVKGIPDSAGLFLKLNVKMNLPFTYQSKMNVRDSFFLRTKLYGRYNFRNVLAAVSAGAFFRVPALKIKEAVESYIPSNNRSQIIHQNSNTFILDAYNANPSSVKAALESFEAIISKNKWIILGDMFELGEFSAQEHEDILHRLKKFDGNVILVGPAFKAAAKKMKNDFALFHDSQQLAGWFSLQHFSDQTFLIKGSRKMMLEKIVPNNGMHEK